MRQQLRIAAAVCGVIAGIALAVLLAVLIGPLITAAPAHAADVVTAAAPASLSEVITNIRNWLITLLVALATLLLTVGGVRYLLAGSDPGETAKAKDTLKYAAFGYAIAALAPLLTSILKQIVGA